MTLYFIVGSPFVSSINVLIVTFNLSSSLKIELPDFTFSIKDLARTFFLWNFEGTSGFVGNCNPFLFVKFMDTVLW